MQRTRNTDLVWLAAILLLGAALRIYGLNAPLWYDEIQTLRSHVHLTWPEMVQSYSMNHHYLHNFLVKLSVSAFGEHAWSARLPAMLFGLGTLAASWVLARRLAGVAVAHVSALLLALSYHEIWFSTNARGYTGLAFFSTLGMIFFLRGLRDRSPATWIFYGLSLAAAIHTHLTGAFFFLAQGLVWLGITLGRAAGGRLQRADVTLPLMAFILGGALAAIVYLPLLPSLLETVSSVAGTSAVDPMKEYQNPLWTAYEAIRTGIGNAGPLVALVGAAVLALSVLGAVALHRDEPAFALVTFLHIGLTIAILMAVGMRIWPRFFFTDIGFLMILIVLGVRLACSVFGHLLGGEKVARVLFAAATIAMVAISALLAKRNFDYPKQDLVGATRLVQSLLQPGDRVYGIGYAGENLRYYDTDWPVIYNDAEYSAAMAEPGRIYLVVGFPERVWRDMPILARDRDQALTTVGTLPGTLGDGAVVILRRD